MRPAQMISDTLYPEKTWESSLFKNRSNGNNLAQSALELLLNLKAQFDSLYDGVVLSVVSVKTALSLISILEKKEANYQLPNEVLANEEGNAVLVWNNEDRRVIFTIVPYEIHISEKNKKTQTYRFKDHQLFTASNGIIPSIILDFIPKISNETNHSGNTKR